MTSNKKKLTKAQLATIKQLFMEYKGISQIAREFNVARNTITWHINNNGWRAERALNENETFSSFDEGKKVDFVNMTQAAITIMSKSLQNLATRHEPPTMTEATRAADILKTLDNILRLDEGKPTDIVENQDRPLDDKELKEKLAKDPFSGVEKEDEKLN